MANLSVALTVAQADLNDRAGTLWTTALLLPHVREAHVEMQIQLDLNGIPVIDKESAQFTINAGSKDMGVNQPADLIDPINMKEKGVGEPDSMLVNMTRQSFTPDIEQTDWLRYWNWDGELIQFVGSTANRIVELYYVKGLAIPQAITDPIGFIWGESYLGPRIASLAAGSVGNWSTHDQLAQRANKNLDTVVRMNVLKGQSLPTRKRPFMYWAKRARRNVL